jgi:hypothetical protein
MRAARAIPEGREPLAGGGARDECHPRTTRAPDLTPAGVAARSIEAFRVIFNSGFVEQLDQFLAKRFHTMMLFLSGLASCRDADRVSTGIRWYRSCLAQPPANG